MHGYVVEDIGFIYAIAASFSQTSASLPLQYQSLDLPQSEQEYNVPSY